MASRAIGYVEGRNYLLLPDLGRRAVPVVMHDDEPIPPNAEHAFADCDYEPCVAFYVEPAEITEARAYLPAHRPTDRDWFAHYRDRA